VKCSRDKIRCKRTHQADFFEVNFQQIKKAFNLSKNPITFPQTTNKRSFHSSRQQGKLRRKQRFILQVVAGT